MVARYCTLVKKYITIQSIAQVLKCENNGIPIDSLTSLSMVKLVSMILVESVAAFLQFFSSSFSLFNSHVILGLDSTGDRHKTALNIVSSNL